MMKKILLFLLLLGFGISQAQQIIQKDAEIDAYVKAVSADSLEAHIEQLMAFGTRHTMSDVKDSKRGIIAAREWVLSKFQDYAQYAQGRMQVKLLNEDIPADGKRIDKRTNLGNVMAILKGIDTNDPRIFLIGGHLDSRVSDVMNAKDDAPGANDDGSGVAGVIEAARVLSRSKFPATVIFVTFSGEEQGLLGAQMLADKAKKENWKLQAVLNNDMIGNNQSNGTTIINNTQLRVFSTGFPLGNIDEKSMATIRSLGLENDGSARQLARYIKEIGERYIENLTVKMIYRNDRFLRGGDHTPFAQNGFAAVRLTEMNENYDHQHQDLRTEKGVEYGDLSKFMDFEYLRKNTGVNVANLANLSKAPSVPQEVKMEVKELTNFTVLHWKKPQYGNVKGYFVLIRETDQAQWQRKYYTTDTQMKLPFSKDNYFFAVQSVSLDGNESLAVVPSVK